VVNAQTYAGYVVHVGSLTATTGASIKVNLCTCFLKSELRARARNFSQFI